MRVGHALPYTAVFRAFDYVEGVKSTHRKLDSYNYKHENNQKPGARQAVIKPLTHKRMRIW